MAIGCSGCGGTKRLHASQLAFSGDALMRLVHALYPIFKLSGPLGQLFCYFKRAARDVAANSGFELDELADVKFVGWHGAASNAKPDRMYHGKLRSGDGFATWMVVGARNWRIFWVLMAGAAPGDSGEGPGFSLEH
jgi:hypothetical protein